MTDDAGRELALSFPGPLPTPTISGDTALYPEVMPGVDLRVQVTPWGGFGHVLVVKSAAAAADPRLATLTFTTAVKGLTVSADAGGNLDAKDSDGTVRFHAPTPRMWDAGGSVIQPRPAPGAPSAEAPASAPSPSAPTVATRGPDAPSGESSSEGPGTSALSARVPARVTARGIELTPDRKLLTSAGTRYPVYIDPGWVDGKTMAFAEVQEGSPTTSNYNSTQYAGAPAVGYCGFSDCAGKGRERSYFRIQLDPVIRGAYNINAVLHHASVAASGSSSSVVQIRDSNVFYAGVNWNNQPCGKSLENCSWVVDSKSVGVAGSSAANVDFNVTGAMEQAAGNGWNTWAFVMTAANETNSAARKRFVTNPVIEMTYDKAPNTPTGMNTAPGSLAPNDPGCNESGSYGTVAATDPATGGIKLQATVSSPTGHNVTGYFTLWDSTAPGSPVIAQGWTGFGPSGSTASYAVGTLTDGHTYGWNVKSDDGVRASAASANCHFTVRKTPAKPTGTRTEPPATAGGWIGAQTNGISLKATVSGPDTGQLYRGRFRLYDATAAGRPKVFEQTTTAVSRGSEVGVDVGKLTGGPRYEWEAESFGPYGDTSETAPASAFSIDTIAPTTPAVTSPDFPALGKVPGSAKRAGEAGSITVAASDAQSGLVSFEASLNGTALAPAPAVGGTAALTVTPPHWGSNVLTVRAVDLAGNRSATTTYSFYIADSATGTSPALGDLNGDSKRKPDLLVTDPDGNLRLYGGGSDNSTWKPDTGIASTALNGPYDSTWSGVQVSHRGSMAANNVDDLIVHKPGDPALYVYTNNGTGSFPASAKKGVPGDWSHTRQVLALGNALYGNPVVNDRITRFPDLVSADDTGALWLHPAVAANRVGDPVRLAATGWADRDLIAPGDTTGDGLPDLWARDRTTGDLWQFAGCAGDTSCLGKNGKKIATGLTTTLYPSLVSDGDLDGDGFADLWSTGSDGRITELPGRAPEGGSAFGAPAVIIDSSTSWQECKSFNGHNLCGPLLAKYLSLGKPDAFKELTTEVKDTADGTGRYVDFAGGTSIYWSPATGAWPVGGEIRTKWLSLGGTASSLSYPNGDERAASDNVGRVGTFIGTGSPPVPAAIFSRGAGDAHALSGDVLAKYLAMGGPTSVLRYPVTDTVTPPDGIGRFAHFQGAGTSGSESNGSIYWSPGTGAHWVHGSIRTKWAQLGWETGFLGYPASDEATASDGSGQGYISTFAGRPGATPGAITHSDAAGSHEIHGAIYERYQALGGPRTLGFAATDESPTPTKTGAYNHFMEPGYTTQTLSLYWSPATGAHEVHGDIRTTWSNLGWENSWLGFPTSDEFDVAGGRRNSFENGTYIRWNRNGTGSKPYHDREEAPMPRQNVAGDFNGDGRDDVATFIDYGNCAMGIWTLTTGTDGKPTAPVERKSWNAGAWCYGQAKYLAGDFDADGRDDLAALYGYGDGRVRVFTWLNRADGTFDEVLGRDVPPGNWSWNAIKAAVTDVNGDRRDDIAFMYDFGNCDAGMFTMLGQTDGTFNTQISGHRSGPGNWCASSSTLLPGDFNGDGRGDVAVMYNYGGGNGKLWTFPGRADGSLAPAFVSWQGATGEWWPELAKYATGDFNGDGRTDIGAAYGYPSGGVRFFTSFATPDGGLTGFTGGWDIPPGNWSWNALTLTGGKYTTDNRADLTFMYDYGDTRFSLSVVPGQPNGTFTGNLPGWDTPAGLW